MLERAAQTKVIQAELSAPLLLSVADNITQILHVVYIEPKHMTYAVGKKSAWPGFMVLDGLPCISPVSRSLSHDPAGSARRGTKYPI